MPRPARLCPSVLLAAIAAAGIAWAGVAVAQEPSAPPLAYNASTDTKYRREPMLPKLGPAGFLFKDPTFGCPIVRVSDEKTFDGEPILTLAGAAQNTWNTDSTLFVVLTGGGRIVPYRFDPKTMNASRIPDLATLPDIAGDSPFSYHDRDVCWGKALQREVIVKYDFAKRAAADVVDVAKVTGLPVNHMGALSISANDVLALTFGGAVQDKDPYLLVYDAKDGTHHLWNTKEGSIDGRVIANAPRLLQHSSEIDRSGRYVRAVGPGAEWPVVWDVEKGTLAMMTAEAGGHGVLGYGDMVNDVHKWVYRTLDPEGLRKPVDLMEHPAGEAFFAYDSHISWNNTRPLMKAPVVLSTYRPIELADPRCAWGNEIVAVATDGSKKVWRFAHHRSTVHTPDRAAGGGRYNFWDTPRGNVSQDGRFFMFTSNWEETLGDDHHGRFRQDVFIVKLERDAAPGAKAEGAR
jgi:hypothetical protein